MSDKKQIIRCDVSNSITSIMSNVTAFAKKFILYYFPDEYFKDIYIVTSATSNEQAANNDNEDLIIKKTPQLSITPTYNQDYDDVSGGPFPMWRRGFFEGFKTKYSRYGYRNVFYNDVDELGIFAIPNRIKFTFNYKIRLDSHLKKIDVCHMLRQKLHNNDIFYYNNVTMETQIPNVIIQAIAAIKDFDLTEPEDVKAFKAYLSQYSPGNINEKVYTGSGLRSFVYTYLANILIKVTNPPDTDGGSVERQNMAEGKPTVEFTLDMELWIPNNYMFECNFLPRGSYMPIDDESKVIFETLTNVRPPQIKGRRARIVWNKFVTDVNVVLDKIDLKPIISKRIKKLIKNRYEENDEALIHEIFDIDVYRDSKILEYGKDYKIDWENLQITMINPYYNYVYYVAIYADQKILYEWFQKNKKY